MAVSNNINVMEYVTIVYIWVIWLISISSGDILIIFWPCSKAFSNRVSVDPESNLVQKVYLNVG